MMAQDTNSHHRTSKMILGDAQFRYYPLWDVKRNDVFCHLCEAFWEAGGDYPLVEDELASEFEDPGRILSLDLETLHEGVGQAELMAQYGVLRVLIPVHFETLADSEAAESYTGECNKVVWPVFDDVNFEIIKPPPSVPGDELAKVADLIKPYGQATMLRVEPGFECFDDVPADAFLSLGMNLRVDPRCEDDIISELIGFAEKAKQAGLQCHVHGLESVTVSAAAVSSGFDFIGSDAIAPHLERDAWNANVPLFPDLLRAMLASRKKA